MLQLILLINYFRKIFFLFGICRFIESNGRIIYRLSNGKIVSKSLIDDC